MSKPKPERGLYRSITVVLLDGPDFQELPAIARWVFVALKISLGPCGIQVEYPEALVAKLAARTGYPSTSVHGALDVLEQKGWVKRERNVVWVVGQLQNEPSLSPNNPNHRPTILAHIKGLPRLAIVGEFIWYCQDYFDEPDKLAIAYPREAIPIRDGMGDGMGDQRQGQGGARSDKEEVATTSAKSRTVDGPTDGQIMAAIRTHLYSPDSKPPEGWDEGREFSIMRQLRKLGKSGAQIMAVVEGLGELRRDGRVDWLKGKATLRAVYNSRSGCLDMWGQAEDAYYTIGKTAGPAKKSGPVGIGKLDILGTIGRTA